MGEAVGTRRTFTQTIPTLGVAAWGTIRDRNQLVNDKCEVKFVSSCDDFFILTSLLTCSFNCETEADIGRHRKISSNLNPDAKVVKSACCVITCYDMVYCRVNFQRTTQ